jgi:hypothetical protein
MADHEDDGGDGGEFDDDVFVYMGGLVPHHLRGTITHVRVHESVKIITARAFQYCTYLVSIEIHNGVEIIEAQAFYNCESLMEIKLSGVSVIEEYAFTHCTALADVEFGDKLETIGRSAFLACKPLRNIKTPKVRNIGEFAFARIQLMEAELSEDLETLGGNAFAGTPLRNIKIPLKHNLLQNNFVFSECDHISQVDLVGGIHQTVSSLLLDSWRNEMSDEIDRINRDLPNTSVSNKTTSINSWMVRVLERIDHFKSEHSALLKEFTTLLELALWKAKLDDESQDERSVGSDQPAKKAKIDMKAARQEQRITSGANIVIKNVLPFLKLE